MTVAEQRLWAARYLAAILRDERGLDEGPSSMIKIAVSVGIAIAAMTIAVAVFNAVKDDVDQSPSVPAVGE